MLLCLWFNWVSGLSADLEKQFSLCLNKKTDGATQAASLDTIYKKDIGKSQFRLFPPTQCLPHPSPQKKPLKINAFFKKEFVEIAQHPLVINSKVKQRWIMKCFSYGLHTYREMTKSPKHLIFEERTFLETLNFWVIWCQDAEVIWFHYPLEWTGLR